MKKTRQFLLFIVMTLAFFACKKDADNTTAGDTTSFTFKQDGNAVTIDSAHAVLYTLGIAPFGRMIDVFAYKSGLEILEFHFRPVKNSYIADGSFANSWLTYKTGLNYPVDYYNSVSGTLNVTLCDTVSKKIEGTFNFVGNNGSIDKNITEGVMKVDITEVR